MRLSNKGVGMLAMLQSILILLALLLVVAAATGSFGALGKARAAADVQRACTAYLIHQIKAADTAGAVSVRPGPQTGDALVLRDDTAENVCETRFYLWDGMLMQEYSRAQDGFAPQTAYAVAPLSALTVEIAHGLVTVQADSHRFVVSLRTEGNA